MKTSYMGKCVCGHVLEHHENSCSVFRDRWDAWAEKHELLDEENPTGV